MIIKFFLILVLLGMIKIRIESEAKNDYCPDGRTKFVEEITMGFMKPYWKDYPDQTLECYKDIQKNYEETIESLKISIKTNTKKIKDQYSNVIESDLRNKISDALSAFLKVVEEVEKYQKVLEKAVKGNPINNTVIYALTVNLFVSTPYSDYKNSIGYFNNKRDRNEAKAKSPIDAFCKKEMEKILSLSPKFVTCMKKKNISVTL